MGAEAAVDGVATDWIARGPAVPGQDLSFAPEPGPAPPVAGVSPPIVARLRRDGSDPTPQPALQSAPPVLGVRPAIVASLRQDGSDPGNTARQFPTASPDAAAATARQLAKTAETLGQLQRLLTNFDGCALKATAKSLCFYRGADRARLMLIGEAPGREEDLEGRPFVGRAGQLLDKMLTAAGLSEADVHITNVVYWRPPGNRTPTPQEVLICQPFLERQIELVAPEIILLLGGVAAKAVLDVSEGIMRVRGKWHEATLGRHTARVLATLHPAFLLRTPAAKRLAWRDILTIRSTLAGA